jgi:hypothetical protein
MITIKRQGNLIQVTPSMEVILGPELTYVRREHIFGFEEKIVNTPVALYELDATGALIAPAGFTTRICHILHKMGYPYKLMDLRSLPPLTPDYRNLIQLRDTQDEALAAIISHDHGIIAAPTAYGKSYLIRQICLLYPDAPIIVVAPGISVARSHYTTLTGLLPRNDVGMVGGGKREYNRRVTVSTKQSLMRAPIDACRILLYDEVHEAAAPGVSEALAYVRNARMYGFTASPVGRGDCAEPVIEGFFGPVIYSLDYQEAVKRGIVSQLYVNINDVNEGPEISSTYSRKTTRFKHGIWYNLLRNQKVCDAARKYGAEVQVLVIVDTVQHALVLRQLMPEFEVCYNSLTNRSRQILLDRGIISDDYQPITLADRIRMQEEFESRQLLKVIATPIWNVGVSFDTLEVLVRADAGVGEIGNIQVPGRLSRIADGKTGAILEDFSDRWDKYFRARALARINSYTSRGWEITNDKKRVGEAK